MRHGARRSVVALFCALASIAGALGCGRAPDARPDSSTANAAAPGEPSPGGAFTTDSASYTARVVDEPWPGVPVHGFRMITRYTNSSREPIYLATCLPDSGPPLYTVVTPERSNGRGIAYNAARACVGHERPIVVPPGATRVDTLPVRGPNGFDGDKHIPVDSILEGRFRLRFGAQSCPQEGACALTADSLVLSNEFSVRVQR